MKSIVIFALVLVIVHAMPVEQGELTGGRSVPHPNSAAGQALSKQDGFVGGRSVPHPNSAAGQALSNQDGFVGGPSVPYPYSAAGQAIVNKNLEEKSVLEGGTQVKPWLKNQPDVAAIRNQGQQQ